MKKFSTRLILWHETNGRKDLPWQKRSTPYKVWISEIMLQQTQVSTVTPYFKTFIKEFPNVRKLAETNLDQILSLWSGLGYYARARNIHEAAKIINTKYKGKVPNSLTELISLPGIGKSTAGAILALGYKKKAAILDGNVKRVLSRHCKIKGDLSSSATIKNLWQMSEQFLPEDQIDTYTQAIMDLGATVCTKSKPTCPLCPVNQDCQALKQDLVEVLPTKSKVKAKQIKKVFWLIPQGPEGDLLLEKRNSNGLWGGLWTFIESEKKESLEKEFSSRFETVQPKFKKLNKVKHSFSHFKLEAIPYLAELKAHKKYKNTVWVNSKNVESLGLPTPVKRIIEQITAS